MGTVSGKRILIAGTGSGCGKTTAVCGILYGLCRMGMRVGAFKSGPDYIDPMFHQKALGIGSGNLDLFFSGPEGVRRLLAERSMGTDISIVEGAMGYYDGIGMGGEASCHELAEATGTPVVLVVDPAGMGQSVLALIRGFVQYSHPGHIVGILFNRISRARYEQLKPPVEAMGLKTVGFIPGQKEFVLESRHLGLVTAGEIKGFHDKLELFYRSMKDTVDWKRLIDLSGHTEPVSFPDRAEEPTGEGLAVGIARDEAFCFLYEDNLRYLERTGCRLLFFSPLRERALPEGVDCLILCGGYPELYAGGLSANQEMRTAVREAVLSGLPCIAECGGFLYLQKDLKDGNGEIHQMAGVFPGHGMRRTGPGRFGYIETGLRTGNLFGQTDMKMRAHEFHYYDCDEPGEAFLAKKASGAGQWLTGMAWDTLYAGFPHIYFEGNERFAESFLAAARRYHERRMHTNLQE